MKLETIMILHLSATALMLGVIAQRLDPAWQEKQKLQATLNILGGK